MLTLAPSDHVSRCTCCGDPAALLDDEHGALCWECLDDLLDVQDFLDAIDH